MSNARAEIKADVLSTLKGILRGTEITLFDGTKHRYDHTFGKVANDLEPSLDAVRQFMPCAFVTFKDSNEQHEHSRCYRSEPQLIVTVYFTTQGQTASDEYGNEIWLDVLRALSQDITRGGYAIKTVLEKTLLDTEAFAPYGILEMFFTVTHFVQT